jgi:hypothetical protein
MLVVHSVDFRFNVAIGTRTSLFQDAFNMTLPILGHFLDKIKNLASALANPSED